MGHSLIYQIFRRTISATACALALTVLGLQPAAAQLPPDPDSARALQMRAEDGFTLAAVGDLIISRPVSQETDPRFRELVRLLQRPDVTFGNFENTILELGNFGGYPSALYGGLRLRVGAQAVRDLKALGFDMVSRANNHTTDWGGGRLAEHQPGTGRGGNRPRRGG